MSLAASQEGFRVVSLDISKNTLNKLRDIFKIKGVCIPLIVASLTDLPFREEVFDSVISCDVIEHVPDTRRVLAEFRRVLRTSGRLCLTVPNGLTYGTIYDIILLRLLSNSFIDLYYKKRDQFMIDTGRHHVHEFTAKSLRTLLENSDLRIVRFENLAFLATYMNTIRGLIRSRVFDQLITTAIYADMSNASRVPLAFGSEWIIVSEKSRPCADRRNNALTCINKSLERSLTI